MRIRLECHDVAGMTVLWLSMARFCQQQVIRLHDPVNAFVVNPPVLFLQRTIEVCRHATVAVCRPLAAYLANKR